MIDKSSPINEIISKAKHLKYINVTKPYNISLAK